jgi:LPXTG-motif cell wall-anchored protein
MPEFTQEPWFFVVMGVVLVTLIGLFLFLRNKRPED